MHHGPPEGLGHRLVVGIPRRRMFGCALAKGSNHVLDAQSVDIWNTMIFKLTCIGLSPL